MNGELERLLMLASRNEAWVPPAGATSEPSDGGFSPLGPRMDSPTAPPPFPEPPPQQPVPVNCRELVNQRLEPLRQRLQEALIRIDSGLGGVPIFAKNEAKRQLMEEYEQQKRKIEAETFAQCEEENRRRQLEYQRALEEWNRKRDLFFNEWSRRRNQAMNAARATGAGAARAESGGPGMAGQGGQGGGQGQQMRCGVESYLGNLQYVCRDATGKIVRPPQPVGYQTRYGRYGSPP